LAIADARLISLGKGSEEFKVIEIRGSSPARKGVRLMQKLSLELSNNLLTIVNTYVFAFLKTFFKKGNPLAKPYDHWHSISLVPNLIQERI
jgi:hypothetical protein